MAEKREVVLDFNLSEAVRAMLQYKTNVKDAEGATTETEKAVNKLNKELDEQIKLEQEQGKQIKTLQKRLGELVALQQKATDTKDVKKYNAEIKKTTTAIQKLQTVEKGRSATIKRLEKDLDKLGKTAKKAGESSSKSFRDLLEDATSTVPQVDKVRGLLAKFGRAAGPIGLVATAVAGIGLAGAQVSIELSKIAEQIRGLTGQSKEQALQSAASVKALADTYNIDLQTAIVATNTASKNFGVDFNTAIGSVNDALAGGLRFSEEYLENLKEYPSALGLTITSLEDFNALIALQQQEGFFNDKLVDAVKEFEISIRELTPATKDAFGAAGLSGALDQFKSGAIDARQLLDLTGKQLNKLGIDSEATGLILADVFRSAGEDGVKPLIRVLGDFNNNLAASRDRLNEMGEAERNLFEAQTDLNEALSSEAAKTFSDGITNLKASLIEYTAIVLKSFSSAKRFFSLLAGGVATQAQYVAEEEIARQAIERTNEAREKSVLVQQRIARLREVQTADLKQQLNVAKLQAVLIEKREEATASELEIINSLNEELKELEKTFNTLPPIKTPPPDPPTEAELKKAAAELKRKLEEAARNEELRLRLKAQIEIEAAGGGATEGGLDLLEILAQQDFADQAVKLKLDNESIQEGILNIEKEFAAKRQVLRDQQAQKQLADEKALSEAKAQEQKAAFEGANLLALEQFKREEELAQRRLLANSLSAGTDLQAQQRAAEQFQQDSFDAELRYLDNLKILKQTTNQSTIDEAKRVNEILLQMQEGRLEAEVAKEQGAAERRNQIRQALLSGASQVASAISEIVQVNLDNELAAVEGNKIKEEQIRKKFAEKQKRLQLVQAVINVAQGITSALGSAPPPANFILAALTAAAGAIQVAAIARQKFRKGGHGIGGHTGNVGVKDETNRKVVGLVHQDEWVAPEEMTKSPTERGMIDYMESVRLGKPNTDLLKEYAKKKGIIPDVVYMPLSPRPEIPVLSGRTVQDASKHHIEIKGGKVDINYDRLSDLIAEKNDSEQRSEYLFSLLREQQDSNLKLRAELMNVREEVKKLRK